MVGKCAPCQIVKNFQGNGPSDLWAIGVMGRRNRDLTPNSIRIYFLPGGINVAI